MAGGDGWVCTANTPSNPDISGIGVISAFLTQAILSNLLGWYVYLFRPAPSSTSPSRTPKFIHRLRTCFPTPVLKDLVLLTSDTQSLTGISLLVASFTQSMPAYHAVIVVNVAWMPSLSHHLAMAYVFPAFSSPPPSPSRPKSRRKERGHEGTMRSIRLGVIAIYVLLYTSFCARTYIHLRTRWGEECFAICRTCSGTRREMAEVLSSIVTGAVVFSLGYVPFVISLFRRGREGSARPGSGWRAVVAVVMVAVRKVYEVATSVPVSLVGMSFWTAFSALWISGYRAGGGVGEEERWGFGQVLAVLGLAVVVFEGVKAFCGYGGDEGEQGDGEEGRARRGDGICECGRRVTFDAQSGGVVTLETVGVRVEVGK